MVAVDSRREVAAPVRGARPWGAAAAAHPLWVVATVAAVLRAVAVVVLGPLREGVAVPDEAQYLGLAASVAAGHGAEAWQPGYGGSLYDTTATFMRPLSALTWAFGPHQVSGQILAAAFGVVAAVVTTALALRFLRPPYAMLAGLAVAALPSQVYWSSVVLRESMVWATLAGLALILAVAATATGVRLAILGAAGFATLYLLGDLRQQTAVVAAWSLVLASLIVRHRHRVLVPAGAVVIALVAPALTGLGPAGYTFVEGSVPQLAVIRGNLSLGADSSIVDTRPLLPPSTVATGEPGSEDEQPQPGGTGGTGRPDPSVSGRPGAPDDPNDRGPASVPPGGAVLTAPSGESFVLEDSSAGASLSALPKGLVAVSVRPFVWEKAGNTGVRLAQVENLAWLVLYVLAAMGLVVARHRRDVLAFPVVVGAAVLLSSAITQGNLGTAFRHRGQLLWVLALLSAVAVQHLVDRRRDRLS